MSQLIDLFEFSSMLAFGVLSNIEQECAGFKILHETASLRAKGLRLLSITK